MRKLHIINIVFLLLSIVTLAQITEYKISSSDGESYELFGRSLSISENYLIVGAVLDNDNGPYSGSAYIYRRSGNIWTDELKLLASDGDEGDLFAVSVSISGDYAVIGASGDSDIGNGFGSAYIFKREGSNWIEEQKIIASDGAVVDGFVYAVSISGDYIISGASNDENGTGSAYIFKRNGTNWVEIKKLTASDGAEDDRFGLSISGDYAIVGVQYNDDNGPSSGSAYIFERDGANWIEVQKLTASDAAEDDLFGHAVSISGDYAIVGALNNDDNGSKFGSAYIFERSEANWIEIQKLTASDGSEDDHFGGSVSISSDFAIVGAFGVDENGSAYIYSRSGNIWTDELKLLASDGTYRDFFGAAVHIIDNYAVVGAPAGTGPNISPGSAYIYTGYAATGNSLEITTPKGGNILAIGDQVTIQWMSQGNFDSFHLDLSTDCGGSWINIATDINSSQNSYDWVVLDLLSGNCKILLTGNFTGGSLQVESDGVFTIVYSYLFFDDFSYSSNSDQKIIDNGWTIVDYNSAPPYSDSPYRKEMVGFEDDPDLSGNRLLTLSTQVTNMVSDFKFSRIETNETSRFLEGTYYARLKFDFLPISFNDGNVETFYAINVDDSPPSNWAECDFEYLPYDVWDQHNPKDFSSSIWLNTWYSDEDRDTTDIKKEIINWNLLSFEVLDGANVDYYINYNFIDRQNTSIGGNPVYPDKDMQISFANWVAGDEFGNYYFGNNPSLRATVFKVDYVLFEKKEFVYSTKKFLIDSIEVLIAQLREADITFENTLNGSLLTAIEEESYTNNSAITDFILSQNYPNPFNPSTKIRFSLPEASNISLVIYDILGREISVLVNEEKPIGNYEIEFNGNELTSGIYFYRLQAGSFVETKKMIYLK